MTSSILQIELANLISESKRKNSDLRNAAEKSLNELKSLPSTSESQLAADLIKRSSFISPFLIACKFRNAKVAGIGLVCLQRLVSVRAIPENKLSEVVEALKEGLSLSFDIQLKILQALPSLVQNYGESVHGDLLRVALDICSSLQTARSSAVASTAAATFQQIIGSIFERVAEEDSSDVPTITTVDGIDGSVEIRPTADDALKVLTDLCLYIEGSKLHFLQLKSISHAFILELIENILSDNADVFRDHAEQLQVLRRNLMPMITKLLSDRSSFAVTVRAARIMLLVLRRHLEVLVGECEIVLALLTHLMEPDASAPWKRVLAMEIFREIYADYTLVRTIYRLYDSQEGQNNILQDQMAVMVRIASEKPALIGIGRQSSIPSSHAHHQGNADEQATLEAGGVAGVIGTSVTVADSTATGVSTEWSTMRSACVDQADRSEPQPIPDTYIYTLILYSISAFSDGLAKFVLPLTVPSESRGKRRQKTTNPSDSEIVSPIDPESLQRRDSNKMDNRPPKKSSIPINPLDLHSHPAFRNIQLSASIIESLWAPVLATCSTFFSAALDSEFYHNLVRSFQKLAHVAGLLRLSTPRDAFLTALGKAAVPSDILTSTATTPAGSGLDSQSERKYLAVDSPITSTPTQSTPGSTPSFESATSTLTTRNLLCLRALLNLGIALGPTLDEAAWSILLETLQQADLVIAFSLRLNARQNAVINQGEEKSLNGDHGLPKANMGSEVKAVETAARRMFESTFDYPNTCFVDVMKALLKLSGYVDVGIDLSATPATPNTPRTPTAPKRPGRMHQGSRSISIPLDRHRAETDEMAFVLSKVEQLANANVPRFSQCGPDESGWTLLSSTLISIIQSTQLESESKLKATGVLNNLIIGSMRPNLSDDASVYEQVQKRALETLKKEIAFPQDHSSISNRGTEFGIQELALETLKSILEHIGESLVAGWDTVFDLICSAFERRHAESNPLNHLPRDIKKDFCLPKSPNLVRTSFSSLQLIGSDYLELLPASCLSGLVDALLLFCLQHDDFNISLTAVNYFWKVSDFLQAKLAEPIINSETATQATKGEFGDIENQQYHVLAWSALWQRLLLSMKIITLDDRPEIRNGTVQTLYRIFDANGHRLSPHSWRKAMDLILFSMLEDALRGTNDSRGFSRGLNSVNVGWRETSIVMIRGLSSILSNFLDDIILDVAFFDSWDRLLGILRNALDIQSLELSAATFTCLAEILRKVNSADILGDRPLQVSWKLWDVANPARIASDDTADAGNQDVIAAYLDSYKNLYRLSKDSLSTQHVKSIVRNLQQCVWESSHEKYASDINSLTPSQKTILDSLKSIMVDIDNSQALIADSLSVFADSAFTHTPEESEPNKPTFISLTKSSIELVQWSICDHGIQEDLFTNGTLTRVFSHLSTSISRKYSWKGKDKTDPAWQKATLASLNILEASIPYVTRILSPPADILTGFWTEVLIVANGILSADCTEIPRSKILADEQFDKSSFLRLHALISGPLSSPAIPDSLRSLYARTLFTASLIHLPRRHDLPVSLAIDHFDLLYHIRMGHTTDVTPTLRVSLSYTALVTLFRLVSTPAVPDVTLPSQQNISLAKAAAPYLILRSALPIKSYTADQPLRGLMPQSFSQKKELLFVLNKLVELRSVDEAVPETEREHGNRKDTSWKGKRHLWYILPLVEKAMGVAGKENTGEVLSALREVLAMAVRSTLESVENQSM